MDDALAVELGATIHGAVTDVQVHADGYKKSISSPGIGNYLTFAKAVARAMRDIGEEPMRRRSFVQAHGTGTPQNRTSESQILSRVAGAFGIEDWPIAAIKCFVGHTMAAAGGDQLASSLGVFERGILPGIATIDEVAADVEREHLRFSPQPLQRSPMDWDAAFLNAKGFGGNNATATIASPGIAMQWLEQRHGRGAITTWQQRNEAVVGAGRRMGPCIDGGHRRDGLPLRPRGPRRGARPDRGRRTAHRGIPADPAAGLKRGG